MDTEKAWKEFRANDSEQVVKSSTAAMLEAILSQQNALNAKLDLMRNDGAEPPEGGTDVPPMGGAPLMGGEEEGGEPPAEGAETMPPMDATALMGGVPENLGGTEPPEQMPPAGEGGTAPAVDDGAMPPMDDTEGAEPTPDIDKNSIMDLFKGDNSPFNTQDDGYDPNIGAITDAITNMTDPGIQLSMTNVLQEYLSKKLGGGAPEAPPETPVDEGAEPSVLDELLSGEGEAPSEDTGAISDIIDEIANLDAAPMDEPADEMPPDEGTVDLPPETEEESPEEEKTSDDNESEKEEEGEDEDEESIKKSAKSDDDKKDEEEESSEKEEDKADDKDKDKGDEKSEEKPRSKKDDDSSESFADKFFSTDDDKKSEEKSDDAPVSDDEDVPDEEIDIEEEPLEESDVAAIEEVIGKKMSELIDTVREMLGGEADTDVNPMIAEGTVDLNPGTDPFCACDTPEAMDSLTRSIDDLMNDRLKGLRGYDGKMYKVVKSEAEIKREKTEQLKRSLGSKAVYHMTGEEVLNAINGLTGGDLETIKKSTSYLYPYDVIVRSLDTKIGSNATDRFLKSTVSFKKSPAVSLRDMIRINQENYRKNLNSKPLTTIDLADMSQFNPELMDGETKKLFNALIYNILLADYHVNKYGENGDFEKKSYTNNPWAKHFQTNKSETTTQEELVTPEYYGSNEKSKGMMTQRMIDLIDSFNNNGELADYIKSQPNITPASLYSALENNSFNDVYKAYDDAVKIAETLKNKGIDVGAEEAILLPYLESLGGRFKYMAGKYGFKSLENYLKGTGKDKGVLQHLNPTVFKGFAEAVNPDKLYESLDNLTKGGTGNRLFDRYVYNGPGGRRPGALADGTPYNYYDPKSISEIPMGNLMRRSIISGMVPDLRKIVTGSISNDYESEENPRTLNAALKEYEDRDQSKDKEIGFDPSAGITNLKKGTKFTGKYGMPVKKTSDGEDSFE